MKFKNTPLMENTHGETFMEDSEIFEFSSKYERIKTCSWLDNNFYYAGGENLKKWIINYRQRSNLFLEKKFSAQMEKYPGIACDFSSLPKNITLRQLLVMVCFERGYQYKYNHIITKFTKKLGINNFLDVKLKHLSDGCKQIVSFLISRMGDPEVLIWINPINYLDAQMRNNIFILADKPCVVGGAFEKKNAFFMIKFKPQQLIKIK